MKSRVLCIVLLFSLICGAFSGCVNTSPDVDAETLISESSNGLYNESESNISVENSSFVEGESNEDLEFDESQTESLPEIEESQDEVDLFTANGQDELPEYAEDYNNLIKTDVPNLYKFNVKLPEAEGYTATGDYLQMFYFSLEDDEYVCEIVNIKTAETVSKTAIDTSYVFGTLKNGGFWTVDNADLSVTFYDVNGNEEKVYSSTDAVYTDNIERVNITSDGKYLAVIYYDDQGAEESIVNEKQNADIIDLQTGEKKTIYLGQESYYYDIQESGSYLVFCNDNGRLLYNVQTGETENITDKRDVGLLYNGIYSFNVDGGILLGSVKGDEKLFYMPLGYGQAIQDLDFGYAVVSDYFDKNLSFYNLRTSEKVCEAYIEDAEFGVYVEMLDSGRVFIIAYSEYGTKPYIFDLPKAITSADSEKVNSVYCSEKEMEEKNQKIADDIYEICGIEYYFGSQGNDFLAYDYVGAAALDNFMIYNYSSTLLEVLSRYPKGMLKEAYADTNKGMRIYLCGDIYGVASGGLDQAGGLTFEEGGYICIALDIKGTPYADIPHELSHAFDRRISHISYESDIDWMYLWDCATPMDDGYVMSYDDYVNNLKYTAMGDGDDEVWFIDGYARTYPTEDRARIMQALFEGEDGGMKTYFEYENLLHKARLYSYILRQCFPSCNTEDVNYWEEFLGEIDETVLEGYDMSQFINNGDFPEAVG